MNIKSMKTIKSRQAAQDEALANVMSARELAKLGGGEIAYIKTLTSEEAHAMFPAVEGLPQGISLYSLHAADGTPIALTDTMQAAIGHAIDDDLAIAAVH